MLVQDAFLAFVCFLVLHGQTPAHTDTLAGCPEACLWSMASVASIQNTHPHQGLLLRRQPPRQQDRFFVV